MLRLAGEFCEKRSVEAKVEKAARDWLEADVDPETRAELEALLSRGAASHPEISDRFMASLEFGTAGLRGVIGAGPNRMNRAVVLRTTNGLAMHLIATVPETRERGVVIGYDGRKNSRVFAEDTACVLAAHGIPSYLAGETVPTPLTAFAVKHLRAVAGVMVTASHNPPEYNGYKVYWGNGAQIIPPIDVAIAAAIAESPPAREVKTLPLGEAQARGLVRHLGDVVTRAYLDAVAALSVAGRDSGKRDLAIVYTPMHGVGGKLTKMVFAEAGFPNFHVVAEQAEPDEKFPTVAFPNPEEKGAMDLSFALAKKVGADLIIANDPDADRLALAVPNNAGGYMQFTGNQVGVLLGHYVLRGGRLAKDVPGATDANESRCVLASLVSSPMLGTIALELGVHYEETLTGFKWIANRAMDLERTQKKQFVFGYEEALGYTVGDVVRDKDGISAALIAAEMAAVLRERGSNLLEEFRNIARVYGLFVSEQVSVTKKGLDGAAEIKAIMARLRQNPPAEIGPLKVTSVTDVLESTKTTGTQKVSIELPKSDVLVFELTGRSRIIARPSGTEPKIKYYFDVREPMQESDTYEQAETRARAVTAELKAAFLKLVE